MPAGRLQTRVYAAPNGRVLTCPLSDTVVSSAACITHRVRPPSAKVPQPACSTSVVAVKRLRTVRSADQMTLTMAHSGHHRLVSCAKCGDDTDRVLTLQNTSGGAGKAGSYNRHALRAADVKLLIETCVPEHARRLAIPDNVLWRTQWLIILHSSYYVLRKG